MTIAVRKMFSRGIAVLAGFTLLLGAWYEFWPRSLAPQGGLYFRNPVEISVPQFRQGDPQWSIQLLGNTASTLGAEGCAVASAAMVFSYYGIDTDPGRLNRFLTETGGYTERGWICWDKAAAIAPATVEHIFEDLPSYYQIDFNLLHRNPVIIRLRYPNDITHFVVIVGKNGFDYLIRDPGHGAEKGVYPLHEFGSKIEALRFYRKK